MGDGKTYAIEMLSGGHVWRFAFDDAVELFLHLDALAARPAADGGICPRDAALLKLAAVQAQTREVIRAAREAAAKGSVN